MTDKPKISDQQLITLAEACFKFINQEHLRDNHLIMSKSGYDKLLELDNISIKLFKTGKWNNK